MLHDRDERCSLEQVLGAGEHLQDNRSAPCLHGFPCPSLSPTCSAPGTSPPPILPPCGSQSARFLWGGQSQKAAEPCSLRSPDQPRASPPRVGSPAEQDGRPAGASLHAGEVRQRTAVCQVSLTHQKGTCPPSAPLLGEEGLSLPPQVTKLSHTTRSPGQTCRARMAW